MIRYDFAGVDHEGRQTCRLDLNQVYEQANLCRHTMRLNVQETSPLKSLSHVEKCGLLPHLVEIKHSPY